MTAMIEPAIETVPFHSLVVRLSYSIVSPFRSERTMDVTAVARIQMLMNRYLPPFYYPPFLTIHR
jgi:hypothetical protein